MKKININAYWIACFFVIQGCSHLSSPVQNLGMEGNKNSTMEIEWSDACLCPISFEVLTDPVIFPDGHSYQKTIVKSLPIDKNNMITSPMTRIKFPPDAVIPNRTLQNIIQDIESREDKIRKENEKKEKIITEYKEKIIQLEAALREQATIQAPQKQENYMDRLRKAAEAFKNDNSRLMDQNIGSSKGYITTK